MTNEQAKQRALQFYPNCKRSDYSTEEEYKNEQIRREDKRASFLEGLKEGHLIARGELCHSMAMGIKESRKEFEDFLTFGETGYAFNEETGESRPLTFAEIEELKNREDVQKDIKEFFGNEIIKEFAITIIRGKIKLEMERTREQAYMLGDAWGVSNEQDKLYSEARGLQRALDIIDEFKKP